MDIYKHKDIDGRAVFSNHSEKRERKESSILNSNALLRKLRPVKNPSKIRPFFRNIWSRIKSYFVVQHPDSIKNNLTETIRPQGSQFTIDNFWKHYERYLDEDQDCPAGLKQYFKEIEEDQAHLLKLSRMDEEKLLHKKIRAETAFINKTIKKIKELPVGKSRLLLLNEELYCSITRTKDGFNLNFVGSAESMSELQGEDKSLFLEGKEKVLRTLSFETISPEDFNLDSLIAEWVKSGDVDSSHIREYTKAFTQKEPTLDDYTTRSNRTDKLFWNIVQSIPKVNTVNSTVETTRAEIRSMRLRTELLVLYDTFERAQLRLDPKSKEYADLKKLHREVSAKVLLNYRKGYLSKKDLSKIKHHLLIIDEALENAKQKPLKIISSGSGLKEPVLDLSKKSSIHSPQNVTPTQEEFFKVFNNFSLEEISISLDDPLSLKVYTTAEAKEFIHRLNELHSQMDILKSGTPEEKKWQSNELFRLFFETPYFKELDLKSISPEEAEETRDKIIDFLDILLETRRAGSLTEYDYNSLIKIHNFIICFNAQATGVWIWNNLSMWQDHLHFRRLYHQLDYNEATHHANPGGFPGISVHSLSSTGIKYKIKWEPNDPLKFHSESLNPHTQIYQHSEMKDGEWLLKQGELREQAKIILEQSQKVQKILNAKTNSDIHEFFEYNASLDHWMRPIHNPYLIGLFRKAILSMYGGEKRVSPEAFFDNLEGVFSYFMEDAEGDDPPDLALLGTITELKQLSRTLRFQNVRSELLAFMQEKPHLLYNPEIRNFFDALFFSAHGKNKGALSYFNPPELARNTIEEEIGKLDTQINEQISKDSIEDPELLKQRFETLVYYNEMLIRLNEPPPGQNEYLEELSKLCRTVPELGESLGYVSRVQLRAQLSVNEIQDLGPILNTYAAIHTSSIDPMNVEPVFEQEMELSWQLIASKLMEMPVTSDDYLPLLKTIFSSKGIAFEDSEWTYEGHLVFKNNQYEVDLKTWDLRILNAPVSFGRLPQVIAEDPSIAPFIVGQNLETLIVNIEWVGKTRVYSFKDPQGIPTQIEDKNGVYSLYKKFTIDGQETWLQSLHIRPKASKKPSKSVIKTFLQYRLDLEVIEKGPSAIPLLNKGLYVNPKRRKIGYVIDASGTKMDFEIKLSKQGHHLKCDSVKDLRGTTPSRRYQINNAADLKNKTLDFLKVFENQNQILIWSKRGELKRVELMRYGLIFSVKNGKLHCLTEPYTGYIVKAEANDAEKKGIHHSLLLEHPDLKKPKKLLVASSEALESQEKSLLPKAKGFGKIALALHYMQLAYDFVKKGEEPPSFIKQKTLVLNEEEDRLSFTAFDIRPYTGEICKKSPKDSFELVKHASLTKEPVLAAFYLKRFPIKAVVRNQKLLMDVIQFIGKDSTDPSIKLKLALKLIPLLAENNKLKKETKHYLHEIILENAQIYLEAGRRVPKELRLNQSERMQLNAFLSKHDLEFYETHIKTDDIETKLTTWKEANPRLSLEERIANFENALDPTIPIPDDQLGISIERLSSPKPLLFTSDEVEALFESRSVDLPEFHLPREKEEQPFETIALDAFQADLDAYRAKESTRQHYILKRENKAKFIKNQLLPILEEHEATVNRLKKEIETNLRRDKKAEKQIAILAGETRVPTFDELRLDFIQGNAPELFHYFDALSKQNAALAALSLLEKMDGQSEKEWNLMSDDLHRLLTISRRYDPEKEPRLLVFEAQMLLNFRDLPGGLNQLDLLENLIADPSKLVQAPTGAGKTSVLSVMESLLKGTGENLVIQKVLPSLYNQTHEKTKEVIGDLFDTLVMPLRFDLKMRLTRNEVQKVITDEGVKEEQIVQASIFKGIYEELYEVIQNKGCVLTDYKSLPLIEEKFLQIGQELVEHSLSETEPSAIQIEHFTYLKKILILLRNKGLESMDEFDQPNRPNQKLQLDLQIGGKDLAPFLIDTTLEIFDILIEDPTLGLLKNVQSDLAQETRDEALKNAAIKMASTLMPYYEPLVEYFLGNDEDILDDLNVTPDLLDKIALCKDLFSIYLPLSLNCKQGSRYARNADGSKTVPCHNGQKQDAKFGTIQEQLVYTIQDYYQTGIRHTDLQKWFKAFKPAWDTADARQKIHLENEFNKLFPHLTVAECAHLLSTKDESLITDINQDTQKVRQFLKMRLRELQSSGYIISMDPLNSTNMSRAASGISATTGAPDSMHRRFKIDPEAIGQIKAGMAYRILNRAKENQITPYDPENPGALITEDFTAIIDGSGAFNGVTEQTARALLEANDTLKQVGYHNKNETIVFEGVPTGFLNQTGFVFDQAHTRGTDIALSPDAHALLTLRNNGFREFSQIEGRLRGEGQTFILTMPQDQAPETLNEVIRNAECIDAAIDAGDIYKRSRQELHADLRNEALKQLLACETIEEFVELFKKEACNSLFITKPQKSYSEAGSYFAERKHIQKIDSKPKDALKALYMKYKTQADDLGLTLEKVTYSKELLAKMPPLVSGENLELECELHVEQEEEMELEVEVEVEVETQLNVEEDSSSKKSTIFYPKGWWYAKKTVSDEIHKAYNPLIYVTEKFLPFERNKWIPKFKRLPFERSMYNVGEVIFKVKAGQIENAVIDDPLVDYQWVFLNEGFIYDIRTNKLIGGNQGLAQNFIDSDEFHQLTAQIKFFDGRTNGYTPQELDAIRAWIEDSGPEEMKRHLLDEVLFYRYREKGEFETSQLGDLFHELMP